MYTPLSLNSIAPIRSYEDLVIGIPYEVKSESELPFPFSLLFFGRI